MSVIKLEVPADNERALSAAAQFFTMLSGATVAYDSKAGPLESIVRKIDAATDQGNADQDGSDDDTADPSEPTIVNGVEVDSAGLPWDRRIHSSAKSKIKDGTWKKLRGVDDELVAQVEAELRQSMNPVAPTPPAPEVAAAPVDDPLPCPPQAPAPTHLSANTSPVTFADAMKKYAAAKARNVISDAQAAEFCQGKGLNGIASLSVCPGEIRGEFVAMVEALAAAAGVAL